MSSFLLSTTFRKPTVLSPSGEDDGRSPPPLPPQRLYHRQSPTELKYNIVYRGTSKMKDEDVNMYARIMLVEVHYCCYA